MSDVKSLRRYYLMKRIAALRVGDDALSAVWRSKQEAEAGTVLPATFPKRDELEAVGYVTDVDIDGSDAEELIDFAHLSRREADAVLAAHAAL